MISVQFDIFLSTIHSDIRTVQPNPSSGSWGSPHLFKGIIRSKGGMLICTHMLSVYVSRVARSRNVVKKLSSPSSSFLTFKNNVSYLTCSSNRKYMWCLIRNGNRLPLGTAVKLWQAGNCPPCASVWPFQSIVVHHKLKGIYLFSKIKMMGVQSSRTVIDNGNVESGEVWFSAGCGCWHHHDVLCNISLCWH